MVKVGRLEVEVISVAPLSAGLQLDAIHSAVRSLLDAIRFDVMS